MARKEHEILFSLNAQMNSAFSGTFTKAQQQLIAMQKDLQELSRIQTNVTAFQKQQQAAVETQKKLEILQQQYDNIQREIQETGTFSSDLENKLLSKQQQIDKTTAALDRQTQKLDQMEAELREAGVDTGNLGKEAERLGAQMSELRKQQEETADGAKEFGSAAVDAFEAAANALAAAGLVAGMKKVYQAYVECINIAGDFEESMSTVAALSGANADELGQLADLAKELGATTKFTAKESADAMGYMAMAGWDAQQMLSGMPGVLQLAAASGEDLAQVSDIVTDSMSAFGLTAADTARYADVLAATATNSNTSVSAMGETFKNSASLAGALGYSVEDVAVAIGLMANAGIKGSNAGTALKNIFSGLIDTVTLSSSAFGDVEYSAINADGTMKSFAETIDDLRYYFAQMTGAEKMQNAEAIAGQRAMAGFVDIMNAAELDFQSLTDSINYSAGAAQRMADIRMDNMTGQLTLLNSAWEAVRTTVGEQFTPVLKELYGTGADVLGEVNAYLQEHPQLIQAATVLAGGLGSVATAIVGISAAAKVLKALNIGSLLVGAAGLTPLGWVAIAATGVTALTAAVVAFSDAQDDAEREVSMLTATSRDQYYQLQELKAEYDAVCEISGEFSVDAQILKRRIDEESAAFESSKMTMDDFTEAQHKLIEAHGELMTSYATTSIDIDKNAQSNSNLMNKLLELAEVEEKTAKQKEQILLLVEMLNDQLPELGLAYDVNTDALNMTAEAIRNILRAELDRERKTADREHLKNLLAEENELLQNQVSATAELNARQAEYDAAVAASRAKTEEYIAQYGSISGSEANGRRYAAMIKPYGDAVSAASRALDSASEAANIASAAYMENQAAIDELSTSLAGYTEQEAAASTGSSELAEIIVGTTETIRILTEEYRAAYDAAFSSISGQYALWDEAGKIVETSAGTINNALDSQIAHWNEYREDLALLRERASDIEGLSDVIASFADGSNESVNAVAGMASATDEDLAAMVQNWRDLQQAQSETSDVIAEFKTDFTNQMDELTQQLQSDIEALDMSADAAESGRATIQAFIDSAYDMEPSVRAAYASLGRAAARAMSSASGTSVTVNGRGYAIGTNYAESGLALVGENGPELMMMQGGEKIIPAGETRMLLEQAMQMRTAAPDLFDGSIQITALYPEILESLGAFHIQSTIGVAAAVPVALPSFDRRADNGAQITVPISIHIEGDASPEMVNQLREALEKFQSDFSDRVLDVVEEAAENQRRIAYA